MWKKSGMFPILAAGLTVMLLLGLFLAPAAAQGTDPTSTVAGIGPGVSYITVTNIDGANVRTGPGSLDYPTVGFLNPGDSAPAIGRSLKSEWIQIRYPNGPNGIGWVYAALVTLTGGALPIVEPPPTPTPAVTPTINLTFVAAFRSTPVSTSLPTFTPPPPLNLPDYHNPTGFSAGHVGWMILVLGLIGGAGLLFTSLRRR
jgi:hypothetical protein